MLITNILRLAALVALYSLTFLGTRWPHPLFVPDIVVLLLWAHMEWDLWRKRGE